MLNRPIRMPAARAMWLAWDGRRQAVLTVAALAVIHIWNGPVDVPGRHDVAEVVAPLAPTLMAFGVLTGSRCASRPCERLSPRGSLLIRSTYVVWAALAGALLAVLGASSSDGFVLARNGAVLIGVALTAAELFAPPQAWVPVAVLPMLTWLLGSNGLGLPPEPWAILLEPAGSMTARSASIAIFVLGACVFLGRPYLADLQRRRSRRRRTRQLACGPISGVRSGR